MAEPIVHITDHEDRAESRLYPKLRDIPDSVEFVRLFARQVQELEDAGYTLVTLLNDIDIATGVELDRIGRVIGQLRHGKTDVNYRPLLHARILVNNSDGGRETLIAIFNAIIATPVTVTEYGNASVMMNSGTVGPTTSEDVNLFFDFLFKAKAASVRLLWHYTRFSNATTFTYDTGGQGYDAGHYANVIDKVTDDHG